MATKKMFFLLCILLSMVGTKVWSYDIAVGNADGVKICYIWINDKTELAVTRGDDFYEYLVIPESVEYGGSTYAVTSICAHAFSGCEFLYSITIPNSVTSIGDFAFENCRSLGSLKIGSGVTSIGEHAFSDCSSLSSITIPSSVTSIGTDAFIGCELTSIKVEAGNTKYDSRDNCNAIIETESNTLITGSDNSIIPNSVTSIGDYAFTGCSGLTSITIPNSVSTIGYNAFSNCI